MKTLLTLPGILGTVLTVTAAPAFAQSSGAQIAELLRVGRLRAEVLEMWSPPRLEVLTQRLQQAAQRDPTWWQEQLQNAETGKPLPYHPKLGITEAEYREFLSLADSVRMKPVRTVELVVETGPAGWRFGSATAISGLRGIEIDTLRHQVHSPFGDLEAGPPIEPSEEQRATGPWGGPRWSLEAVDTTTLTGTVAQFALGRHRETDRTIIYYDARRVANGQLAARETVFLLILP